MKDALEQHTGVPVNTTNQLSHQETPTHKQTDYDSIKMRYLRSLNIPIPVTKKQEEDWENDNAIASSAPIPIPKPPSSKTIDDSDEEDSDSSGVDTPPTRGRSRRNTTTGHNKFIPPHEMISTGNSDNVVLINHSLPTNYRRRNLGI